MVEFRCGMTQHHLCNRRVLLTAREHFNCIFEQTMKFRKLIVCVGFYMCERFLHVHYAPPNNTGRSRAEYFERIRWSSVPKSFFEAAPCPGPICINPRVNALNVIKKRTNKITDTINRFVRDNSVLDKYSENFINPKDTYTSTSANIRKISKLGFSFLYGVVYSSIVCFYYSKGITVCAPLSDTSAVIMLIARRAFSCAVN